MCDDSFDVTDAVEFERELAGLVRRARRNGVSVTGGWDVDGDGGSPDFDVVVTVVDRDRGD